MQRKKRMETESLSSKLVILVCVFVMTAEGGLLPHMAPMSQLILPSSHTQWQITIIISMCHKGKLRPGWAYPMFHLFVETRLGQSLTADPEMSTLGHLSLGAYVVCRRKRLVYLGICVCFFVGLFCLFVLEARLLCVIQVVLKLMILLPSFWDGIIDVCASTPSICWFFLGGQLVSSQGLVLQLPFWSPHSFTTCLS